MKKKGLLALIMVLIIGFIPIIFAACGGKTENNISLGMVSGMDTSENDIPVIYLSVDDEENSARDLIFEIKNYSDAVSNSVNFSTDSTAVEISKPTYLNNGRVKVTITAKMGGSALITATTSQFSQKTNFLVKVSEKIKDFNVKSSISSIYFEKGSELKLDLEKYFDFTPTSTTERELKAYIGDELISNENGEVILSELSADTTITFVSEKLEGISRTIHIKVIEKLEAEQISFEKLVFDNNGTQSNVKIVNGEIVELLKGNNVNSVLGKQVDYSERLIKITINNAQENIKLNTRIQVKENGVWKDNNMMVVDTVSPFTFENGAYVGVFKFAYDGYDEMKAIFTYSVGDYSYSQSNEIYIECKQAPNNISINKNSETTQNIVVYDSSNSYLGKELNITSYPLNSIPYTLYLSGVSADLTIADKNNSLMQPDAQKRIAIKNNDTIKVLANSSTSKTAEFYVNLDYMFEGVSFSLQTKVNVSIKRSPTEIILSEEDGKQGELVGGVVNVGSYIFDLNTNEIIGSDGKPTTNYGKNNLTLYLYANVDGVLEADHGYIISNNLGIVETEIVKDNQIKITAKSVGAGTFRIILDNGRELVFRVEVVNSLSSLSLSFPTPNQNSNIYSILDGEGKYLFKVVALTGAQIPPIIRKQGNLKNYEFSSGSDNISYENGYIVGKSDSKEFEECKFTFTFEGLNEKNAKVSITVTYYFQIMFFTQILDYTLTTNKGSTSFDLYDYSSVGFYSEEIATAVISVNISPKDLKDDLLENIVWETNVASYWSKTINGSVTTYSCDIFTFVFDSKTGVGTLRCDVAKEDENGESYFDENGNFKLGKVILSATIKRENGDQDLENMTRSVQFDIVKNVAVEQIVASVDSIYIDQFKGDMAIYTTTYPANASNKNLRAVFVPDSLNYANAIQFEWIGSKLLVKLQKGHNTGKGVIRITAVDSYTESDKFTTYVDIPLIICDGSEEYPYQIISEKDLNILIETKFAKHYQIVGELDVSKFTDKDGNTWQYSEHELKGSITGINNAALVGIKLNNNDVKSHQITEFLKINICALFKSIAPGAKITNIKFVGDIGNGDIGNVDRGLILTGEGNTVLTKVGLIAGENYGTLQNVYGELNATMIANMGYEISFGGLVGENYGEIISIINNEMAIENGIKLNYSQMGKISLTFTDNSKSSATTAHKLYVGGVAGANYGLIKCENKSASAEVNDSLTTVDVNFVLNYVKASNNQTIRDHIDGDEEAIGGIAGYTEVNIDLSPATVGIFGVQTSGKIIAGVYEKAEYENGKFIGHFNNVGGIAGYNTVELSNCITKVTVAGRENVGGGAGANKGDISYVKVQALERNGDTLITGNNNVGGIIGNMIDGAISYSTFISYVAKNFAEGKYNGDIVVYDAAITENDVSLGRLIGVGNISAGNCQNCVAIANVKYEELSQNGMDAKFAITEAEKVIIFGSDKGITNAVNNVVDDTAFLTNLTRGQEHKLDLMLTFTSTLDEFIAKIVAYEKWAKENYAEIAHKEWLNGGYAEIAHKEWVKENNEQIAYEEWVNGNYGKIAYEEWVKANPEEVIKTSFIVLAPTEITKALAASGTNQQLVKIGDETDPETVFYLILHQNADGTISEEFAELNQYIISNYIDVRANSNTGVVLTSGNENILKFDGVNAIVLSSGLVTITVTSEFNKTLSTKFYIYVIRNMEDLSAYRTADRVSSQITDGTREILDAKTSYMIYFKYLDKYNEKYLETDQILIAIQIDGTTFYADDEIRTLGNGIIRFSRISSEAYQLTITGLTDSKDISFVYYVETIIGENVYRTKIVDKSINGVEFINFKYEVINETKSITVSDPEIVVLPYYSPIIDVTLVSENKNEEILILTYLDDNGVYKTTTLLNVKPLLADGASLNDLNGLTSFQLQFELTEKAITTQQNFKVVIKTSNNLEAVIYLTFNPQLPNDITVELYPENDKTSNDGNVLIPNNETFTYISTNKIIPGPNRSLLQFLIVPDYTHYDYILIKNLSTNEYKIVFELFDRANNKMIIGAQDVEGGIIVPKSVIEKGAFALRIFVDSRITDLTTVGITIDVMRKGQDGKDDSLKSVTKTFYVEHLPGVRLEVDGIESGNAQEDAGKLANGVEYSMNVVVKGYESGAFGLDYKSKTYTDGELRFEVNDLSLAKIQKNSDGTYSIIPEKNGTLEITTYGEKLTPTGLKTSKKVKIYLEIVDFVVKLSPSGEIIGDIIKEVNDGVHYSAVGNKYTFEVTLNDQMLVYNRSNSEIITKVENFLTELSKFGSWYVKDVKEVYLGWSKISTAENFEKYANLPDVNNAFSLEIIDGKIIISFKAVQGADRPTLLFKFESSFYYHYTYDENGALVAITPKVGKKEGTTHEDLIQEFKFDITEKTNVRNPYPIRTLEEFLGMVEGNYYILLEDITLPTNFTPITTLIGGLDGNNHQIEFPANLDYDNPAGNLEFNFGLFETIAEGALIQNIQIYIPGEVSITLSSYNSILAGMLASRNYGIITNCSLVGPEYAHVTIATQDTVNNSEEPSSIIAGLVAENYGSITNSRVECSITSRGNMAGFVYKNEGTISSSYFYGSVINDTSSTASKTAGFVGINDFGGYIFSSYITGDYENIEDQFATSNNKSVYSRHTLGAFVYSNSGTVSNCYSNIPVADSTSYASGFVYLNDKNGLVEYAYSTSKMTNNRTSHTPFVGSNAEGLLDRGIFIECYGVRDIYNKVEEGETPVLYFNVQLGSNEGIDGLEIIYGETINEGFNNQTLFKKFALSTDENKTNGVWFFASSATEKAYEYNGEYLILKPGRPELVSPNIIVDSINSRKEFEYTYVNDAGETIYRYSKPNNEGEMHNPYVIASVDDMELIVDGGKVTIGERKFYRLATDIIYESGTTSSELYKYYFLGNLEGNGFTIGNYVIDSSDSMESAGFFAGLGSKFKQMGSIKNATFAPRYINLPNTNSVGAVAGMIYGGNIVNVKVDGFEYDFEGLVILGKNTVGGVAGYITGNYIVNNVVSNISVNATYRATLNKKDVQIYNGNNIAEISHAGTVFGIVDGSGKLDYIEVFGDNVVIGESAGLMFGYVGNGIVASELVATASGNQFIKADTFGGVVAGISAGTLQNIIIKDNSLSKNSFFADAIYKPVAIGNIVGYMLGGKINTADVKTTTYVSTDITTVGGAVGAMRNGELAGVVVQGDISAGAMVGGLVGYAGEIVPNGFSAAPVFNALSQGSKIVLSGSYLVGNITSNSSSPNVYVGTMIGTMKTNVEDINEVYKVFELQNYFDLQLPIVKLTINNYRNTGTTFAFGIFTLIDVTTEKAYSGVRYKTTNKSGENVFGEFNFEGVETAGNGTKVVKPTVYQIVDNYKLAKFYPVFKVTFYYMDVNGKRVEPFISEVVMGDFFEFPAREKFQRVGYEIDEEIIYQYYVNEAAHSYREFNGKIQVTKNWEFEIVWTPIKYTIKFNVGAGSGTVADKLVEYDNYLKDKNAIDEKDRPQTFPDCTVDGLINTGWELDGEKFTVGSVIPNLTSEVKTIELTAIYKKEDQCSITLDTTDIGHLDKGVGNFLEGLRVGDEIKSLPEPKSSYYKFKYWILDANANLQYKAGQKITIVSGESVANTNIQYGNHTLTAVYDPNICNITIRANNDTYGQVSATTIENVFYGRLEKNYKSNEITLTVYNGEQETKTTITASPNDDNKYKFVEWVYDESAKTLTANFKEQLHRIDLTIDTSGLHKKQYLTVVEIKADDSNLRSNNTLWNSSGNYTINTDFIYGTEIKIVIKTVIPGGTKGLISKRLTCEWNIQGGTLVEASHNGIINHGGSYADALFKEGGSGTANGYITQSYRNAGEPQREVTITIRVRLTSDTTVNISAYSGTLK